MHGTRDDAIGPHPSRGHVRLKAFSIVEYCLISRARLARRRSPRAADAEGSETRTVTGGYPTFVMRLSVGGATGEWACRYRANASRSTSPPSGAVHDRKTV